MYIENNQNLDGWFTSIRNIVTAPLKTAAAVTKTVISGGSIGKAVTNEMKPVTNALMKAAPILPFVPVIGTGLAIAATVEKARQAKVAQQAQNDAINASNAETARINAEAAAIQRGSTPVTANAAIGQRTAENNFYAPPGQYVEQQTGTQQQAAPVPWGAIASGVALAVTLLKP